MIKTHNFPEHACSRWRISAPCWERSKGQSSRNNLQRQVSIFWPSWIALHIGNYTARIAAKGSAKRKEEHLKQERNNFLARRAVWWWFSWWSIMPVKRPKRTVDLWGPWARGKGIRWGEHWNKWRAVTAERGWWMGCAPQKAELSAGE